MKLGADRPLITCCYDEEDSTYTGEATTIAVPVLDGSDLLYNWTVVGPSHTILETNGSSIVMVFNSNASYVVMVTVWNSVSSAAVQTELASRGVACYPPGVQLVGSTRRSELRSRNNVEYDKTFKSISVDYMSSRLVSLFGNFRWFRIFTDLVTASIHYYPISK